MSYRVTVTAGAHAWDVTAGAAADYGLADPVTIQRSLPDVDLFPAQPQPAQATFTVIVPDAVDLADLAEGAEVAIHVYAPATATDPIESFHGRISDASAAPHPLGCVYDFTCVDYLAELADEDAVWEASYSTPFANDLVDDIFAQLGLTVGYVDVTPPLFDSPFVAPDPDTTPDGLEAKFLELLERWLFQWVVDDGDPRGLYRFVLDQKITADALDPTTPYVLRPVFRAGGLDPTTAPDPDDALVIDGDYVESSSTYTTNKRQAIRRIKVKVPDHSPAVSAENPGTPKNTFRIDSDAIEVPQGEDIAAFYLPADVPRARWVADTFTWRLDKDPAGTYLPQLGDPVAISPVAAAWNPLGYPWVTGRLTGYTLTIAKGRHQVAFTVRDTAS